MPNEKSGRVIRDMKGSWKTCALFGLFSLWAALIYSNTFDSPFVFDGKQAIRESIYITDFWQTLQWAPLFRKIPFLSFHLNYAWTGFDVWSWHLVSILIHAGTALGIALLLRQLIQQADNFKKTTNAWPFLMGFLFLCHPLLTSTVNYLYQRATLLATLFYVLTLFSYVLCRQKENKRFLLLAFVMGICACLSKRIAMTLPCTILIYEMLFFREFKRPKTGAWLLFVVLSGVVLFVTLDPVTAWTGGLGTLRDMYPTSTNSYLTFFQWGLTQIHALPFYLKLFFWPVNQSVDHDFGVVLSASAGSVVLVASILVAMTLVVKFRKEYPLMCLGVFWFLITLGIHFFAIRDAVFEHRMYLPSIGLLMVICDIVRRLPKARIWGMALFVIVLLLSVTTYQRNAVWANDISLWQDAVNKSPSYARPRLLLANALADAGQDQEALKQYRKAVQLKPDYAPAFNAMGNVLQDLGQVKEAEEAYLIAIAKNSRMEDAIFNLATLYYKQGKSDVALRLWKKVIQMQPAHYRSYHQIGMALSGISPQEAVGYFQKSLELSPGYLPSKSNLAGMYIHQNKLNDAERLYREILSEDENYIHAHANLGTVFLRQGRFHEALEAYGSAAELKPDFWSVRVDLANTHLAMGNTGEAIDVLEKVMQANPNTPNAKASLGEAHWLKQDFEKAEQWFLDALRDGPDMRAHVGLGKTYNSKNRTQDSLNALKKALAMNPNHGEALFYSGISTYKDGNFTAASKFLKQGIALYPQHDGLKHYLRKVNASLAATAE